MIFFKQRIFSLLLIFSLSFFIGGCEKPLRNYYSVDLSNKGIIMETNLKAKENIFYRFNFDFFKPNEMRFNEFSEIIGRHGANSETGMYDIYKKGIDINLKLIISPLSEIKEDYKFRMGNQTMWNIYTYPKNKPFELTLNLAEYGVHSYTIDKETDLAVYHKKIVGIFLEKDVEYKIKVENLNEVDDIKKVKTKIVIEKDINVK